jgi:uncharacterized membrane protein YjjP (DUF1212 family)
MKTISAETSLPSQPPDEDAAAFRAKVEMIGALGKSLHEAGLPAHLLEDSLVETALRCHTPVQVFSMPTGLWMSVDGGRQGVATLLLRVDPGVVHLERLDRLAAITRGIARGSMGPAEAKSRIDAVMHAPPRWGRTSTVLAYLLSAAAFSVFFGGGIKEVVTGMCVGLVVGLLSITFQQRRASRRLFELTAAAAAAVIANIAYAVTDAFTEWIPLAAGLIILLPGLALCDAVEELAHGHLTSGSARMAGVAVVLLAMTFGAVLGITIVTPVDLDTAGQAVDPLPEWFLVPALLAVAVGSTIRFRGRVGDVWIALAASTLALVASRLGKQSLGTFAGPFIAALLLGLAANLFARLTRRPSNLFIVPGLALLVPGSFGLQSIGALLSENTIVGVDTAFHMFLTAMALVTGLLFSNAMYRERSW